MQREPLCRDPLDSELNGQIQTSGHDLLPPLHLVSCFLVKGDSEVTRSSIFPLAVSTCRCCHPFKLAAIWRIRRQRRPWLCAGSWRMETLVPKSLHMSAKIHVFFLALFNPSDWVSSDGVLQIVHPLLLGWLSYRRGDSCSSRGYFHVLSGLRCRVTQGSSNDTICACGTGRKCSLRDDGPYPGCSLSGTAHPSKS